MSQNSQSFANILPNVDNETLAASTVVRIIGKWVMRPGGSDAEVMGTLGIVLLDTDAAAAAALPDPQLDNASWLFISTQYNLVGRLAL